MSHRHRSTIIALTLAATAPFALGACADLGEPESSLRDARVPTRTLELELSLPAGEAASSVEAIARTAEALAGEQVAGATAVAKLDDAGKTTLTLTLWGSELPVADALVAGLRSAHPQLEGVEIDARLRDGAPEGELLVEAEGFGAPEDETPEEVRARVIDELRAKGIEGDIHVEVDDAEGERRVEVRVEQVDPAHTAPLGE